MAAAGTEQIVGVRPSLGAWGGVGFLVGSLVAAAIMLFMFGYSLHDMNSAPVLALLASGFLCAGIGVAAGLMFAKKGTLLRMEIDLSKMREVERVYRRSAESWGIPCPAEGTVNDFRVREPCNATIICSQCRRPIRITRLDLKREIIVLTMFIPDNNVA